MIVNSFLKKVRSIVILFCSKQICILIGEGQKRKKQRGIKVVYYKNCFLVTFFCQYIGYKLFVLPMNINKIYVFYFFRRTIKKIDQFKTPSAKKQIKYQVK